MKKSQEVLDALKKSGLRITEPRKAIVTVLVKGHGPFTIDEIHRRIPKQSCDLVTIYRSMESMEEAEIVRRCEFGDGVARFELLENEYHHHHVICKKCEKVDVLEDCDLKHIDRTVKRMGYTEVTHSLEFFGYCSDCEP